MRRTRGIKKFNPKIDYSSAVFADECSVLAGSRSGKVYISRQLQQSFQAFELQNIYYIIKSGSKRIIIWTEI